MIQLILLFLFSIHTISASEQVQTALQQYTDWDLTSAKIETLSGGLTNDNYLLRMPGATYVVRCSAPNTQFLGYSQELEWQIAQFTASIGLSPKTILFIPAKKIMISEFIDTKGRRIDLKTSSGMKIYCDRLRLLHGQDRRFAAEFCPFETIQQYALNAIKASVLLPARLTEYVLPKIKQLKKTAHKKVLCHLDLHRDNILLTEHSALLIDWESAAMADPYCDLASTCSIENFSDDQMYTLLKRYLQRAPTKSEKRHLYTMRILADVRWALWSYLQSKISPIEGPYIAQGQQFLEHGIERLHTILKKRRLSHS